jgi:hypothetical protein
MKRVFMIVLGIAAAWTLACDRGQDTKQVDTKSHTETTASGAPIEKESETASRLPDDGRGAIKTEHDEYVGVVTKFTPGKALTIKAADGESHSFDLNDRKAQTSVEPGIGKGSKVRVTVQKGDNGEQQVKVTPQS